MAKVFEEIDDKLRSFIEGQQMFFVATAPLAGDGLVNLSPKGLDGFRILDPHTVAYLDLTGSGVETVAHIRENERITFLFCAFEGPPRTLRLYGRGQALLLDTPEFDALRPTFPELPGARAIVKVDVTRIADSCGWGVPLYDYRGQRDQLFRWAEQSGPEKLHEIRLEANAHSLDGLPGLDPSRP
jgi:hypothetical protein